MSLGSRSDCLALRSELRIRHSFCGRFKAGVNHTRFLVASHSLESVQLAPGDHPNGRPDLGTCFWNPLEGYSSRASAINRLTASGLPGVIPPRPPQLLRNHENRKRIRHHLSSIPSHPRSRRPGRMKKIRSDQQDPVCFAVRYHSVWHCPSFARSAPWRSWSDSFP